MNLFTISQLARFSGVEPHTLRMWERRYNALTPDRTQGNTRLYNGAQLRRLLNIVSLKKAGHRLPELCALPDEKLFRLVAAIHGHADEPTAYESFIPQLIAAGIGYDEAYFEKVLAHCLLRYGMQETYVKILYPMLVRIGLMWASDAAHAAQEHFISNLVRQKLFTAIDVLPPPKEAAEKWLLFLPEDEFHELGLLLASYLIRLSGRGVIYLGGNVPMGLVAAGARETGATHLLLFLVRHDQPQVHQVYLDEITASLKKKQLLVAGSHQTLSKLKKSRNMHWLSSVDDLKQFLQF